MTLIICNLTGQPLFSVSIGNACFKTTVLMVNLLQRTGRPLRRTSFASPIRSSPDGSDYIISPKPVLLRHTAQHRTLTQCVAFGDQSHDLHCTNHSRLGLTPTSSIPLEQVCCGTADTQTTRKAESPTCLMKHSPYSMFMRRCLYSHREVLHRTLKPLPARDRHGRIGRLTSRSKHRCLLHSPRDMFNGLFGRVSPRLSPHFA